MIQFLSNYNDSLRVTGIRAAITLKKTEARKNNIDESGIVKSSQTGVHPQLEKYVRRHLEKI
jgi:hypothetical protein